MMRFQVAVVVALVTLGGIGAGCGRGAERLEVSEARRPVAETTREDVIAQAPWRVQDADATIPFDVAVADAYRAGLIFSGLELNHVRISVWKNGVWTPFYYRSFGGYDLADSSYTEYLFLLHVTQGAGAGLIDGQAITAKNLLGSGFTTGIVDFVVDVSADGTSVGKGPDYQIRLQTRVAGQALPHGWGQFAGWYAGDLHSHTMYTHNWAEYGLPQRSLLHAAHAIGLDWAITTDHSCDLDPTCGTVVGFDNLSTRIPRWTFCENAQALPCTRRDHSSGFADGLAMARDDAADAEAWAASWSHVKLHAGEEVTVLTSENRVAHLLAFNTPYVFAPGSGSSMDCDPVTQTLASTLAQVPADGLLFAAHPTQPLPAAVNGGAWPAADLAAAMASSGFHGIELWNMRRARVADVDNPEDTNGLNPFTSYPLIGSACTATSLPHECYPVSLETEAVPYWDGLLSQACGGARQKVLGLAGSDAHGDFNYVTYTSDGLDMSTADDNALGKVRTVALASSGQMADVLAAIRAGRTIMTDGPMVTFGLDLTGDGTIDQLAGDGHVGSEQTVVVGTPLGLHFKWQTTAEFGNLAAIQLVAGDATTGSNPAQYDVLADASGLGDCGPVSRTSGACSVTLTGATPIRLPVVGETRYYRVVGYSGAVDPVSGYYEFRALTNPIWLTGVAPAAVELLAFSARRTVEGVQLSWRTGAETECGAFSILRCGGALGECAAVADHAELPGLLVPCAGDATGGSYQAVDASAADGAAYSYYLREHDTTGATREYGPALVGPVVTDDAGAAAAPAAAEPAPLAASDGAGVSGCTVAGGRAGNGALLLLLGLLVAGRGRRR